MNPANSVADYSTLEKTVFTRNRLRRLNCYVVGAGALGNEVVRILGLLGTSRVTVIDPDVVEPDNLPRSFFFCGGRTIGRNKATAVIEAAADTFPGVRWTGIDREVAEIGFQKISEADLLFSCVDSDLARLEIAYISTKLRVPVVDGGLGTPNHSHGRVTYFPGTTDSACYGCMLRPRTRRELLELWNASVRSCSSPPMDAPEFASTPTMAAAIGAIQVEFGLQHLFLSRDGFSVTSNGLELRLHPEHRMSEVSIPQSPTCPFHQRDDLILHTLPRSGCSVRELLDRKEAQYLELDWPICTRAQCMTCGHTWSPILRLAALRRRGCCPACAAKNILETEVIRTIGYDSPWVGRSPSDLGLPAHHLYTLRGRSTES